MTMFRDLSVDVSATGRSNSLLVATICFGDSFCRWFSEALLFVCLSLLCGPPQGLAKSPWAMLWTPQPLPGGGGFRV